MIGEEVQQWGKYTLEGILVGLKGHRQVDIVCREFIEIVDSMRELPDAPWMIQLREERRDQI